jgi:hypothetical protein
VLRDEGVIHIPVVGNDHDQVVARQHLSRQRDRGPAGQRRMLACLRDHRHPGVVVIDAGAALLEALHDLQRRALAHVLDIRLVGHADQQDLRTAQSHAGSAVQGFRRALQHIERHAAVDLAGKLDEACAHTKLARFPGQVERIDRDTVAAQAGTGIEWHVAKRLGLGRLDHLPDIDPHCVVDDLELVDQGDVHGAEDVFGNLHRFGDLGGGDRDDALQETGVERLARFSAAAPCRRRLLGPGAW